jgi:hypothetical protein
MALESLDRRGPVRITSIGALTAGGKSRKRKGPDRITRPGPSLSIPAIRRRETGTYYFFFFATFFLATGFFFALLVAVDLAADARFVVRFLIGMDLIPCRLQEASLYINLA